MNFFKIKTHQHLVNWIRLINFLNGLSNLITCVFLWLTLSEVFYLIRNGFQNFYFGSLKQDFATNLIILKFSGIVLGVFFGLLFIGVIVNYFLLIYTKLPKIQKANNYTLFFFFPLGLLSIYYSLQKNYWKTIDPEKRINWKLCFRNQANDDSNSKKIFDNRVANSKIVLTKSHLRLINYVSSAVEKMHQTNPEDLSFLLLNIFHESDRKKICFEKCSRKKLLTFKAVHDWTPKKNFKLVRFNTPWFSNHVFQFSLQNPKQKNQTIFLQSFLIFDLEEEGFEKLDEYKKFIHENKHLANTLIINLYHGRVGKVFVNKPQW